MKKLMIALGAAASMAWCANAVESKVSGIDFDLLTAGNTLSIVAEDDGRYYWETAATEISSTIKALDEDDATKGNYLAVDETVPLYRTMNGSLNTVTPATGTSLAENGVYFKSDVQFTASDETSGAGMVAEGDKLLVWLRATEAVEADPEHDIKAVPATTNLIITAMNADGTGSADYVVANSGEGGINIDPATWYTLTIKAKQTGGVGEETAEFEVYVGDTKLASGQKTSFTSLVAAGGTTSTTITSVGFKGTGALDNLEFGTFTEVVQKCTVSVSVTYEEGTMLGIMVDGSDPGELPCEKEYTIASGAKSTIVVTVDDGYVVTYNNKTYTPVEGDCTIEIDLSAAKPNDTVNVDLAVVKAGSEPTTEFPKGWNGGVKPSSKEILDKYETWAKDNDPTAENAEDAFLLNVASDAAAADKTLAVTTIVVEGGTVKITSNHNLKAVNGVPYILTGDAPNAVNNPAAATLDGNGNIQYTLEGTETKKFYKIGVGYAVPAPAAQE